MQGEAMPDVPENLRIGAIMREAMAQHRIGRLAAAESLYRQAMLVDATDADIRHNLGIALAQQGKFAAAAPHLVAALETHPERSHYWKAALEALQSIGDLEGQAALYRRLVVLQPQLAPAHYNLGNVLRDLNRLDEAEAAWKSAVKLDTAFARAHNNLGSLAKY